MTKQPPRPENTQKPDDLPAFVNFYFSGLNFAPHVTKDVQDFIKGHVHAFALFMRAKYRPPIMVAEGAIEDMEAFTAQYAVTTGVTVVQDRGFEEACVKGIAAIRYHLSEWIIPDSGITDSDVLAEILEITDNPKVIPMTPSRFAHLQAQTEATDVLQRAAGNMSEDEAERLRRRGII